MKGVSGEARAREGSWKREVKEHSKGHPSRPAPVFFPRRLGDTGQGYSTNNAEKHATDDPGCEILAWDRRTPCWAVGSMETQSQTKSLFAVSAGITRLLHRSRRAPPTQEEAVPEVCTPPRPASCQAIRRATTGDVGRLGRSGIAGSEDAPGWHPESSCCQLLQSELRRPKPVGEGKGQPPTPSPGRGCAERGLRLRAGTPCAYAELAQG